MLIYESFNNKDLHEYILQYSNTIGLPDFFHIALQIVAGMIYLSEKHFLHNDLSTRNILISEYRTIKITHIARYRRKYQMDYYRIANHFLPVRWMSIETLLSGVYSQMSDVWSFGVLLWEMLSYGEQPYDGYTNPEVIEMIRDRQLLACPMKCPRKIYSLMSACWEEFGEQRPTFVELMARLRQLEEISISVSSSSDRSASVHPSSDKSSDVHRPVGTPLTSMSRTRSRLET